MRVANCEFGRLLPALGVLSVLFCSLNVNGQTCTNMVTSNIGGTSGAALDIENLFISAFNPGTGDGISIDTDGTVYIGNVAQPAGTAAPSGNATVGVDLDADGNDDVSVAMSYALYQNGDSRIGWRQNTAGTAITMLSLIHI